VRYACVIVNTLFGLTVLVLPAVLFACQRTTSPELIAPPVGRIAVLLDDLEDGDRFNKFGGSWFTYDDRDFGGDSKVSPEVFKLSKGGAFGSYKYARISGKVTTAFEWGFIGMGTKLHRHNDPVDIREYTGIEFRARGDGKKYRLKFRSDATKDHDDYGYDFVTTKDWNRFIINFGDIYQQGWGREASRDEALSDVVSINWQTIDQPLPSVKLDVDYIRFLK
jgi:hypothetical protein